MQPILKCEKLTKKYGHTVALNELDLNVEPGRIVGLFGPKDSGKTTLLKLAAGLLTVGSGSVLIDGCAPGVATKRFTAFLPDSEGYEDRAAVKDMTRLFGDFYSDFDREKAVSVLSDLGIDPKDKIAELSKVSVAKFRLALTMCRSAKLYLLDDPVASVDTATMTYVLNTISTGRPEGSSVLIASRNPSEVERIINDAAFISAGKVSLFADAEKLRADTGKSVHALFTEGSEC